ncbi:hypothetical protein DCAR_0728173 [Daucus carota subsp. sativus]|uniref:RRM domain-containing protein n=1 Tax=Daucus carota subsp. sativus TaxID=79200 RepID=A0AAF0XIC3_DAUCS|nr:hypothetical protein DCAR_0728173 [Daucus carota subsp. sativus]
MIVHHGLPQYGYVADAADNGFVLQANSPVSKKNGYSHAKRRMNSRTSMAQREEIMRTVYVTEEQLAALFISCGQVVDYRVCGDPNYVLRFAFIEFMDEEGARNALGMAETVLGFYPVRVLPSKTAIAPVNPTFLQRDEREMCSRTIYCTNIDKKENDNHIYTSYLIHVTQADVKLFFETFCGEVYRLRLLGDYHHSTRIAFVEFVIVSLYLSGIVKSCGFSYLSFCPIYTACKSRPPTPLGKFLHFCRALQIN